MKHTLNHLLALILLFSVSRSNAQNNLSADVKAIVQEGTLLYKSELASWIGTDLFLEAYSNKENIGGYFSYTENDTSKCVFFSRVQDPTIIGTVSFDQSFNTETAIVNVTERAFSELEKDLFALRSIAVAEISKDTLFKSYTNTRLNLIPLINGNEKKVYIVTGPQKAGVVIFGNDYLLRFDKNNNLLSKKSLHKNIIPIYFDLEDSKTKDSSVSMHNHSEETGDYITATDICTLMLYEKFAKWKTHHVFSKNFLNIWNCETNQLTIVSMDTINKINKDQKGKKKKAK